MSPHRIQPHGCNAHAGSSRTARGTNSLAAFGSGRPGCVAHDRSCPAGNQRLWLSPLGARPLQLERGQALASPIDLNHADRAELLQIPGLGPQLVERLEAYRRDHGGFHNVEELTRVRGIGPATLTRMRSWVYVNAAAEDDEAEVPVVSSIPKPSVPSQPVSSKKIVGLSGQVDLNTASAEELKQLPGIGPKMAQSIIETRSKEPFRSVEDLRRVRGIGVKTLERLRPHVTVPREPARSGIVAGDKDIE